MQLNRSNADIDRMFRDMAKADGYDSRKLFTHTDRLLSQDTLPCEQEQPEQIDPTPYPVVAGSIAPAVVMVVCIFAGVALAVVAWAMN